MFFVFANEFRESSQIRHKPLEKMCFISRSNTIHMVKVAKPVLAGERVTLRPLNADDALIMHASLGDSETNRLTGTQKEHTLEEVQRHCTRIERARDRLDYGIVAQDGLIGEVVLSELDRTNSIASFRMAIWLPEHCNKGLGSEAIALMINHAFGTIGLNRIELEVYAFNPRARHVYEKVGFVLEGTRREAFWWDGEPVDAHIMAMLRSDFETRQAASEPPHQFQGRFAD